MDIYVVRDMFPDGDDPVIGISAKLQGAELIRADYVREHAQLEYPGSGSRERSEQMLDLRLTIDNHELQDLE